MRRALSVIAALGLTALLTTVALGYAITSVIASCSGTTINYTVTGTGGVVGDSVTITLMGNTNASGVNEAGYQTIKADGTLGTPAGAQYVDTFILAAGDLVNGNFTLNGTFDISGVNADVKSFRVDSDENTKSPSFNRNTCPGTVIPESPLVILLVVTAAAGAAWFVWRQSRTTIQPTAA